VCVSADIIVSSSDDDSEESDVEPARRSLSTYTTESDGNEEARHFVAEVT
jgi:hypothetical protein